uniref:FadB n=1 Tax=Pseudonocardia autotrophica TaxID=2074 RepID=Q5ENI1_PSEAH|nr:FadB [Pseudonocardia autotrophica]
MEGAFDADGVEGRHAFECEAYLGLCRRWRDLPKPTIAAAQGRSIAGGLMLLWPMDLIVAAESATFSDPVAAFGLNGMEYFTHAWEVGARKAKEMLFTGQPITASDAHRLGMVNHVVSDDRLTEFTLDLARRIAVMPAYALRLAKAGVNGSLAAQGQDVATDSAFALHIAGHANALARHGDIIDPAGIERIRALSEPGRRPSARTTHPRERGTEGDGAGTAQDAPARRQTPRRPGRGHRASAEWVSRPVSTSCTRPSCGVPGSGPPAVSASSPSMSTRSWR